MLGNNISTQVLTQVLFSSLRLILKIQIEVFSGCPEHNSNVMVTVVCIMLPLMVLSASHRYGFCFVIAMVSQDVQTACIAAVVVCL